MHDIELQPPGVEAIQAMSAIRGERRAAITADRVGQRVPPQQQPQLTVDIVGFHVGRDLAAQHERLG